MVGPMAASAWELVPTTHAPQARTSMAMCALNGGGILLFGGSDGETSGFFKGDTWILSDGDWMNVAVPSAPIARSNAGCVAYKDGAVLFGGFWQDPSAYHSIGVRDDTWMFTPSNGQRNAGTWRELKLAVHPPARAYFSFSPYLGGGLLFGGRNNLYTNTLTVLDDTWTFHNGGWHEVLSARHSSKVLQSLSQPSPTARFGHVVACGLNATVPPAHVENAGITGEPKETFEGPADCMLFGGTSTVASDSSNGMLGRRVPAAESPLGQPVPTTDGLLPSNSLCQVPSTRTRTTLVTRGSSCVTVASLCGSSRSTGLHRAAGGATPRPRAPMAVVS